MLKATPAPSSGSRGPCYLKTQQVVNGANDDVDGGGAAGLSPQIVLEVWRQEDHSGQRFHIFGCCHIFIMSTQ